MKTDFFSIHTLDDEDKEEFKVLQSSDEKLFNEVYEWFLKQESIPVIKSTLTKYFVDRTGEKPETINNVVARVYRLLKIFQDKNNKPEDFIEDLIDSYPDLIVDKNILVARINSISTVSKKYELFFKIEETLAAGVTSLSTSSMSVILKPVINERFDMNQQDIKDYKPEILHYEPCVLFELQKSDDEKFTFQMTSENFERFLNHLISIQVELNAVADGNKRN